MGEQRSIAESLWQANSATATACLRHPFVRGLRDGILEPARYARFIAQDACFLDAFARAYAVGVARAPDRAIMRAFHRLQCGIFEEQQLHERAARELNIDLAAVEPLTATSAYTTFLIATAFSGTLGELLAAMTPCMRLYGWLGARLAAEPGSARYAAWINTYADSGYARLVDAIEALFNALAESPEREAKKYQEAMRLELNFFEMAWRSDAR